VYLPISAETMDFTLSQNGMARKDAKKVGNYVLLKNVGAGKHEFKLSTPSM